MIPSANSRALAMAAALSLAAFAVLVPSPGQAWWRGGVFIGIPPIVVPPVGYPPPPIYSAPPLDYEAPPGYEGGPEAYRSPPAAGQQPPAGYAPPPAGVPETAEPSGRQAGTPG